MSFMLWVGVLVLAFANHKDIYDWWKLHNYIAPVQVSTISTQDTMTDYAQRIFYINHPQIISKASTFNEACSSSKTEQTIVLGCYHSNQNGVYIFDVTDSRLDGVEQVTGAHEMLHAAYDRLNKNEKNDLNKMLWDFYKEHLKDDRIRKIIDAYKKTEPNELVNEMHSIFATEIRDLPAGLEQHYKMYFDNRLQVVTFAEKYQAEFTSRQAAVSSYDSQLEQLKPQIENLDSDLKKRQNDINDQQKNLISLRSSGSIEAYNAGVPVYNSAIDSYNSDVQRLKSLISQYNKIVITRNSIALEENTLAQNLNSNAQMINK